jgi:hypothetical protein
LFHETWKNENMREFNWKEKGILTRFNQKELIPKDSVLLEHGLDDYGFIYIPHNCLEK